MESPLKQRLIGAAVLAALAIIFLPMLLKGPEVKEPDAAQVPLSMPAAPGQQFETRELPLEAPDSTTPPGGVLGVPTAAPPADNVPAAPASTSAAAPAPMPAKVPAPTPAPATPPPATTAPAAAAEPATVAAGNYAVNIGSFSKIDNANALVAKLRAAKLPVIAEHVMLGQVDALRVRVGPYADRTAAEAGRLRADEIAGGNSKVIVLDAGAESASAAKPVAAAATKPAAAPTTAKPAAPAPAAKSAAAAPAMSGFAVQLAAPAKEIDALALRDRARAAGFTAFVQPVDTDAGVRYRVRVGPVADRVAAEQLRDSVNAKLGSKGIVVPHP